MTGVVFLLLARGHYTVDVVLAYGLTYWLWVTYHTLANFRCLKQKHKDNQLAGLVWWHVLRSGNKIKRQQIRQISLIGIIIN